MKRILFAAAGVLLLFASSSCRKDSGPIPPQNPLNSEYQVVEYHRADFDDPNDGRKTFPFKKIYSGRTVVEIDGSYDFPVGLFFTTALDTGKRRYCKREGWFILLTSIT
ncbi:hypothetical protein ACQ86N_14800 [Puia sp. P3]|uniref:hypothetical protein n=1 Tax=Puia sp. P3 TaxID=3423952 RepID=UPI003D66709D